MKPDRENQSTQERAQELLQNAKAAEWILIRAEEYQEKFELSNAAMAVVTSMSWWDRLFRYKPLIKQYLRQLSEVDAVYRKREEEYLESQKKMLRK